MQLDLHNGGKAYEPWFWLLGTLVNRMRYISRLSVHGFLSWSEADAKMGPQSNGARYQYCTCCYGNVHCAACIDHASVTNSDALKIKGGVFVEDESTLSARSLHLSGEKYSVVT